METTLDGLLDRRVTLEQPKDGFRVAVDTVLLAAAVPAKAGERVADFGCGVGGAMLCLATRLPGVVVTGIELQDDVAALARSNAKRNGFTKIEIINGDVIKLFDPSPAKTKGLPEQAQVFAASPARGEEFDHVMINPPYHDEARHDVSAHAGKRAANTEKDGDLVLWIAAAAKALKKSGVLTLIHRADRRDEIMRHLASAFGRVEILPILPKAGAVPKRIIIRAHKSEQGGVVECRALVLHKDNGYTDDAEAILRHAKSVDFKAL